MREHQGQHMARSLLLLPGHLLTMVAPVCGSGTAHCRLEGGASQDTKAAPFARSAAPLDTCSSAATAAAAVAAAVAGGAPAGASAPDVAPVARPGASGGTLLLQDCKGCASSTGKLGRVRTAGTPNDAVRPRYANASAGSLAGSVPMVGPWLPAPHFAQPSETPGPEHQAAALMPLRQELHAEQGTQEEGAAPDLPPTTAPLASAHPGNTWSGPGAESLPRRLSALLQQWRTKYGAKLLAEIDGTSVLLLLMVIAILLVMLFIVTCMLAVPRRPRLDTPSPSLPATAFSSPSSAFTRGPPLMGNAALIEPRGRDRMTSDGTTSLSDARWNSRQLEGEPPTPLMPRLLPRSPGLLQNPAYDHFPPEDASRARAAAGGSSSSGAQGILRVSSPLPDTRVPASLAKRVSIAETEVQEISPHFPHRLPQPVSPQVREVIPQPSPRD